MPGSARRSSGSSTGGTRELLYKGALGEKAAGIVSTGTLLALLATYMWLLQRRWPLVSEREALSVGAAWAAMTVLFESAFGHWVEGEPWSKVLEQYDVTAGNPWIGVPISMLVGPEVVRRLTADESGRAGRTRTSYAPVLSFAPLSDQSVT